MGCDIHLWVEARESQAHRWRLVDPVMQCDWCHGRRAERPCMACGDTGEVIRWVRRDYALFAVLAGVRGWGTTIEPIDEPRGWPSDMSAELSALVYDHDDDAEESPDLWRAFAKHRASPGDHSPSWVTVAELDAYFGVTRPIVLHGVVPLKHYRDDWPARFYRERDRVARGEAREGDGEGLGYSHDVWGPGIVKLSEDEARALPLDAPDQGVYVQATWTIDVKRVVHPSLFERLLPACRVHARDASDVRLVFNFDS